MQQPTPRRVTAAARRWQAAAGSGGGGSGNSSSSERERGKQSVILRKQTEKYTTQESGKRAVCDAQEHTEQLGGETRKKSPQTQGPVCRQTKKQEEKKVSFRIDRFAPLSFQTPKQHTQDRGENEQHNMKKSCRRLLACFFFILSAAPLGASFLVIFFPCGPRARPAPPPQLVILLKGCLIQGWSKKRVCKDGPKSMYVNSPFPPLMKKQNKRVRR